jgi:formamidopyrimidine-DNA glycosylase
MPEGPEVWILSEAICNFYKRIYCYPIGKHLITDDEICWSFGLNGTVGIDENNKIYKPKDDSWIYGQNKNINFEDVHEEINCSKIDWMKSSKTTIDAFINKISKSKSKLGTMLLNQKKMCGIGVAWGSEILHRAGLRPDVPINLQDLSKLSTAMIEIRDEIKELYASELEKYIQNNNVNEFILNWFENLYEIRQMRVYKVGTQIDVGNRKWWISNP